VHALAAAEALLSEAVGAEVRFVASEPLTEEHSVFRCTVSGEVAGPRSVIVRTHRLKGGWRTDPSYFLNDYAATRFLHAIGSPVAVRLLGADPAAGVQMTEDLGTGTSLDDLLGRTDRAAAADGLVRWARALGELHAATVGRADEYYRLRASLGPVDPASHRTRLVERSVETAWAALATGVAERNWSPVTDQVGADVAELLHTLREPGPFLALSNGDACPYNSRITSEGVRFFDFELAGFRHCLLDGAFLRMSFPSCYRWGRLPDDVRTAAEDAYRAALGTFDDDAYRRGLVAACGAWAIVHAVQLADPSQQAQLRIERLRGVVGGFVDVARAEGWLGALATWLEQRAGTTEPARFYPAFGSLGSGG
jgi:hypothetical protein